MNKLLIILIAVTLLTGCKKDKDGSTGNSSIPAPPVDAGSSVLGETVDSIEPISTAFNSDFSTSSEAFGLTDSISSGINSENSNSYQVNPEPSTMVLFSIGLAGLAATSLRKKKNREK